MLPADVQMRSDEQIIAIIRHYWLTYLPSILLFLILLFLPFFLLFLLFSYGWWGVAGFIILLLIDFYYGLKKLVIWYFDCWILTNQRVVDINQSGFFDRLVSEINYRDIQDVAYRIKGVSQTFFHYGTIQIQTKVGAVKLELNNIKKPEEAQTLILRLREAV